MCPGQQGNIVEYNRIPRSDQRGIADVIVRQAYVTEREKTGGLAAVVVVEADRHGMPVGLYQIWVADPEQQGIGIVQHILQLGDIGYVGGRSVLDAQILSLFAEKMELKKN